MQGGNQRKQEQIVDFLSSLGQHSLIDHFQTLSLSDQALLCRELASLDKKQLLFQRNCTSPNAFDFAPFDEALAIPSLEMTQKGLKALSREEIGCIILAGGEGSRLGWPGPKGTCPITFRQKKSLFQLLIEKAKAMGKKANARLPLAIMTSPKNHQQTVSFFSQHSFFGYDPELLDFFPQDQLPFLDRKGNLLLSSPTTLAKGAGGNGNVWSAFWNKGPGKKWSASGICHLHLLFVDNPLENPFDPALIGFHIEQNNALSLKAILRDNWDEQVGLFVESNAGVRIVDYMHLSLADRIARRRDGTFAFPYANSGILMASMEFIEQVQSLFLPLYRVEKEAAVFMPGKGMENRFVCKYEQLLFDAFAHTEKKGVILCLRDSCFAPLKSRENLLHVREKLALQARRALFCATGQQENDLDALLEMDPHSFYRAIEKNVSL